MVVINIKAPDNILIFYVNNQNIRYYLCMQHSHDTPAKNQPSVKTHYPKGSGDKSFIMGVWSRDNCFDNPLSVLALPRACGIESY
jgi:hypothetical protein